MPSWAKRRVQQAWLLLLSSRLRRVLLALVLFCLLFALHVTTSSGRPGSVLQRASGPRLGDTGASPAPSSSSSSTATAGVSVAPGTSSSATKSPRERQQKREEDAARTKLFDTLTHMDTRELGKALRLYNSFKNSEAVLNIRVEHSLQALMVSLLEEVSAHKYSEIMAAAQHARPLSQQSRPGPLQVVIATTWRSGSTFLEELLSSHPAMFNHYEPLSLFGLRQIRQGDDSIKAQKLIHDLLSCRYEGQEEYLRAARELPELLSRNELVWKVCNSKEWGDALCYNKSFLSRACSLFPWSTMKLVRLRLRFLKSLLLDSANNARVVFLVRDPRGVINSRTETVNWCQTDDCKDPRYLCRDLEDDLRTAQELQRDFPGRLYILRYEDLSLSPANKTRELLDYLGLDFDPHMEEFLASHTTKNYDKPWSTSRNSKERITYWASKMGSEKLQEVQDACSKVMAKVGYLTVNSTANVTVDMVLGPLVLPSPPQ